MSDSANDWTNDSEDVKMDWATESETREAEEELQKRREKESMASDAAAAAEKPEVRKDDRPARGRGRGRGRGSRGGRSDRSGGRDAARPRNPRVPCFAVLMAVPEEYKEEDIRKFLTSVAADPVDEKEIENIKFNHVGKFRAIVYFKTEESRKKILKADNTTIIMILVVIVALLVVQIPLRHHPHHHQDMLDPIHLVKHVQMTHR